MDSKLSSAHRDAKLLDERVVDKAWRKDKLPVVDIDVPTYELPLPEGVGDEKLHEDNLSVRQIEETWRERLLEDKRLSQ